MNRKKLQVRLYRHTLIYQARSDWFGGNSVKGKSFLKPSRIIIYSDHMDTPANLYGVAGMMAYILSS